MTKQERDVILDRLLDDLPLEVIARRLGIDPLLEKQRADVPSVNGKDAQALIRKLVEEIAFLKRLFLVSLTTGNLLERLRPLMGHDKVPKAPGSEEGGTGSRRSSEA